MAKLVYLGPNDELQDSTVVEELEQQIEALKLTKLQDVSAVAELRNTTANQVYVVTKPHLMRGYDYRSVDGNGIALLICSKLASARDLKQALGRVGRYGDPAARYKLIPDLIDHEKAL